MKAPNASAARVDGIAATSQCDQKRARPRRQGGGKPRPGQMRMGAPAPAARGPKVALCGGPGGGRDLNHALVQLDESAIAGNVGRDLAFTASRLAARSHPAAGRCGRPCCAVVAGHVRHFALERVREIDRRVQQASGKAMQPMRTHPARSRAHLPRGQWPWTSRSHATACSRRAAPRGKQDGFVAGTRAPRSGLPRVSVRVLASMSTGSPSRRCSCMRSMRATQPVRHRPVIARAVCGGLARTNGKARPLCTCKRHSLFVPGKGLSGKYLRR